MTRILAYALALSLIANLLLALLWQYEVGRKNKWIADYAQAQVKAAMQLAAERDKASRELAEVRARIPKAGRKVSDAVHEAPSDCSVSPAVGNRLREAVREGNAARRSAGAVP